VFILVTSSEPKPLLAALLREQVSAIIVTVGRVRHAQKAPVQWLLQDIAQGDPLSICRGDGEILV
jgi:hypothetical protein